MHHHKLHLGIIDGALCGGAPCLFGAGIIRKHADHLDRIEIVKVEAARVGYATAEDEVKLAHEILVPIGMTVHPFIGAARAFGNLSRKD